MANLNPNPSKPATRSAPAYVSSSGHVLETPPLSARLRRLTDDVYNFLGLYFVSLFSLDPYAAAQNSQFNTRAPGRVNAYQERARWNAARSAAGPAGAGSRGGGPGTGPGTGSGRRMGGIDDVRGPECGSGSCG